MKAVTVKELKKELSYKSQPEMIELCLRLSRFKKENKELLTYLLFESTNEESYINSVKDDIDEQFSKINQKTSYLAKKGIRKIIRSTKKYIRYSKNKETEVELLLHFCEKLKEFILSVRNSRVLINILHRELESIKKKTVKLHEDLQYDYEITLKTLSLL